MTLEEEAKRKTLPKPTAKYQIYTKFAFEEMLI